MAHGVGALISVNMIIKRPSVTLRLLFGEETGNFVECGLPVASRGNDLDAVTGRQNHSLMDRRIAAQARQSILHVGILERDAFAHFDRRAAMVQSDDDDLVLHELFEPAPMPAGEKRVSQKKVAENDTETDHR